MTPTLGEEGRLVGEPWAELPVAGLPLLNREGALAFGDGERLRLRVDLRKLAMIAHTPSWG